MAYKTHTKPFGIPYKQGKLCCRAGFTDEEIAPLFENAHDVENIVLPPNWQEIVYESRYHLGKTCRRMVLHVALTEEDVGLWTTITVGSLVHNYTFVEQPSLLGQFSKQMAYTGCFGRIPDTGYLLLINWYRTLFRSCCKEKAQLLSIARFMEQPYLCTDI